MNWTVWLAVAVGGAVGAVLRFGIFTVLQHAVAKTVLPIGVLSANVLGSFLLGWCFMLVQHKGLTNEALKLGLTVGLLGALTTFSTFALDNVSMLLAGDYVKAACNILLNVLLCVGAVFVAIMLFNTIYKIS